MFRTQNNVISNTKDVTWRAPQREPDPYQLEWEHLMDAIRRDQRYNEVRRGAEASLVTAMGRIAAHSGQIVTREQALNHETDLTAGVDKLTLESPAPVPPGRDGRYPVPNPGQNGRREY